jgi:putative spermidine/putrescine transport system ATP-binding protein
MAFLKLTGIEKSFGATRVVEDFNLEAASGEFVSFLGPSGCGKTTVLRMIAGFEQPSAGTIEIGGRNVTGLRPNQRDIGMVFQAYALFPNMTVAQNIAFGLKVSGAPRAQIEARVAEMLELIRLDHLATRYPYQLSGGQQQRVALARALARQPKLLLLDEPLSALDAKVRVSLREEIRSIQKRLGITTIFVTHDQEEALSISDRIVVMNSGRAEQAGVPFEIYNRPRTRFVASFVGTLNMLDAVVSDPATGGLVIEGTPVTLGRPLDGKTAGSAVSVALRPEALSLAGPGHAGPALQGTIRSVDFLGSVIRIRVEVGNKLLSLDTFNRPSRELPAEGQAVAVAFGPDEVLVLED